MARKAAPDAALPESADDAFSPGDSAPALEAAGEVPALSTGKATRDIRFHFAGQVISLREGKPFRAPRGFRAYIDTHNLPVEWIPE